MNVGSWLGSCWSYDLIQDALEGINSGMLGVPVPQSRYLATTSPILFHLQNNEGTTRLLDRLLPVYLWLISFQFTVFSLVTLIFVGTVAANVAKPVAAPVAARDIAFDDALIGRSAVCAFYPIVISRQIILRIGRMQAVPRLLLQPRPRRVLR